MPENCPIKKSIVSWVQIIQITAMPENNAPAPTLHATVQIIQITAMPENIFMAE